MTRLYGINNCDSVRKARKWLDSEGLTYTFHDFRKDGLHKKDLLVWIKALGWEKLLNKRGTTWRKLPEKLKESVDEAQAITLMLDNPTLIKRPVLMYRKIIQVGFNPAEYKALF